MRFSVIIPLYNKAPYVKKAIESVISQTYRDFEIIVVDDGSMDHSLVVAQSILGVLDLPHQLIHQANSGVSIARNKGAAISQGDYLCFLDADDWWAPTFLEKMDEMVHNYPEAGIYGTNYYYVKNGRETVCVNNAETGYMDYCKIYADSLKMPLWTGAVCIPRTVFEEMGGFCPYLKLGEDFNLWIRIALKYKVAFLNEPHSYYFQDSDQTWRLIGKLHEPQAHMLWNLGFLSEEEKTNPDLKRLVDGLRTYGLFPYYLSKEFNKSAKRELAKVDWSGQPKKIQILYNLPIFVLRCRQVFLRLGSSIKKSFTSFL